MNNTEKFFIEFVFKDNKIMKQLKQLAAQIDKVVSANKRRSIKAKTTAAEEVKANTKVKQSIKSLAEEQKLLAAAMKKASDLGIDIKGYQRSLNQAKKAETLAKRRLQLEKQIVNIRDSIKPIESTPVKIDTDKAKKSIGDLHTEQEKLLATLQQAEKLGIDVKSHKRTYQQAKKAETLAKRRLELEKQINVAKLTNIGEDRQQKETAAVIRAKEKAVKAQQKLDELKSKSSEKSTNKIKSLQQAQIAMLQQITRAYSRGLDGTARYYERIVDKEKDVQRMMRLTQNLREKIERDRLASSKTSQTAESKQAMSERLRQKRLRDEVDLFAHGLKRSAQYESLNARGRTEFDQVVRNTMREVKTTRQLKMAKKDLTSTLRQLSGASRQAERRLLSLRTVQRGLTNSTRNMIHAYASLFAIFSGVKSINSVGQEFEGINSQLLAATGSQQQAAKEMEYLDKLTSRLGLSLIDTADAYAKLRFTAQQDFDEKTVQSLFTGLSEFGRVMAVSKERMKWSLMAVTQMMSKGTVSNEELRRQ